MCGIVAVISAFHNGFSIAEADMYQDLLFFDTLRGWDSTGVFGTDKYGNLQLHKEASSGPDFIKRKEFKEFRSQMVQHGRFAVGHNRAATRGTIKDENAHPFVVNDEIVLVQNGTYKGSHKHHKDTEVDTEAVAHVIASEPDIEKALQKLDASYALVWYNVKERKLNLIRNDERPLWWAMTKSGGLVFASEPDFIAHAAARNNVDLKANPEMVKAYNLVTITFKSDKSAWELDNKEVDGKYRWQTRSNFPGSSQQDYSYEDGYTHRRAHHPMACGWEDWPYLGEDGEPYVFPTSQNTPHPYEKNDPDQLDCSVLDGLIARKEYAFTPGELTTMDSLFKQGEKIILETVDYIHGNSHRDCTVYHIIAKPVTPEPIVNAPWFSWVEHHTEESRAMQIAAGRLYKAEVGPKITPRIIETVEDGIPKRRFMLSFCAMNPTEIPVTVTEKTNEEAVQ